MAEVVAAAPDWVPESLARLYVSAARTMAEAATDASHHWDHVDRVTRTALRLAREEQADELTVGAAGILHDLGRVLPGDHAARSVEMARPLLAETCLTECQGQTVLDAIAAHRYRDGKVPASLEGKILQDADRLDAIGAIGIARCFSKGAADGRALYHSGDPFGESRDALDDKRFAVDHFYAKLLKLKDSLHTQSGRALAQRRHAFLEAFLEELRFELCPAREQGASDRSD